MPKDSTQKHGTHRDALRHLTARVHEVTEAHWTRDGAFKSKACYLTFLARLLNVHQSLGLSAVLALGHAESIKEEKRRISALPTDLASATDVISLTLPTVDADEAWGIAYVVNGSPLGASMMLKNKQIPADWPSEYMHLTAEFARSGRLKTFFEAMISAEPELAKATKGATRYFAALSA